MTLPLDFERSMTEFLGQKEYPLLAEALAAPSPTSMRINAAKARAEELRVTEGAERVPWCDTGFYLPERPAFTFDPLLHAGCYYVQEASSMFLAHILRQYVHQPVAALDLCAAPGGKSTLALSYLPEGSLLVANEVVRQRAHILAENLTKWGNDHCIVTNNYAADFQPLGQPFDLIICDAPCSGEGMFRKDPASVGEWSLANVDTCWRRQRDIVKDIWPTLKEGGLFIYSTCTYNLHEDEENAHWIAETMGAEMLSCQPQAAWKLTATDTHFFPHRTKGEGFFISALRKTTATHNVEGTAFTPKNSRTAPKKDREKKPTTKIPTELYHWLINSPSLTFYEQDGGFHAFPTAYWDILQSIRHTLKVVHAGIALATPKGKNLQPCHDVAMSAHLNPTAFPQVEVDEQQAIAYLRTEALQLPPHTPLGYVLITHQGHPLGFAKNVGNRANNLYPTEWKIRSTHFNGK